MFTICELAANAAYNDSTFRNKMLSVILHCDQSKLPLEILDFLRKPRSTVEPSDVFDLISLTIMWSLNTSPFSGGDPSWRADLRDMLDRDLAVSSLADLEVKALQETSR